MIRYINENYAERLLANSGSPVTDVALQCGFTNLTHFGRVFKDITGITPSAYRRHHSVDSAPL